MLRKVARWDEALLALLSGVLLIISFPPFNVWPAAWVAFIPVFNAVEGKSKRRSCLIFLFCGFIFWLGTIYWIACVTFPGMLLLCLYLAVYFAFFGIIAYLSSRLPQVISPLFLSVAWVILEYSRSHLLSGFPWALLGYSQYLNLPAIQISDITGVWGVSFMVMLFNAAFYPVFSGRLALDAAAKRIAPAIICFMVVLTYGLFRLLSPPSVPDLRVSLIQANIPQNLKWAPLSRDFIVNKFLGISSEAVINDSPGLVIWPEASFPELLNADSELYNGLTRSVKYWEVPLLFGAVRQENGGYYNTALLMDNQGQINAEYRKIHLVPFGEFIPFRKFLGFLETVVPIGDFYSGKEYKVFSLQGREKVHRFSVLICFEDAFPELCRRFVLQGAGFLVNITNDAWFGRSGAPFQHLQASVFRAVENRVWVARSANTGVSAVINSKGELKASVQNVRGQVIFTEGYVTYGVGDAEREMSFYTRNGDVFVYFCFVLFFLGLSAALFHRRCAFNSP